jgi:hypothetical protein
MLYFEWQDRTKMKMFMTPDRKIIRNIKNNSKRSRKSSLYQDGLETKYI